MIRGAEHLDFVYHILRNILCCRCVRTGADAGATGHCGSAGQCGDIQLRGQEFDSRRDPRNPMARRRTVSVLHRRPVQVRATQTKEAADVSVTAEWTFFLSECLVLADFRFIFSHCKIFYRHFVYVF